MSSNEAELEALKWACEQVAWYRENAIELAGEPVKFFDSDDGERFAAKAIAASLAHGMIDPAHAATEAAAGDPLFHRALCRLASAELSGELRLTEPLRSHVIAILNERPRLKRARRKETNYLRDVCLTMLVQEVRDRFGISATGRSARQANACAIVGKAVGMEGEAVKRAVQKLLHEI